MEAVLDRSGRITLPKAARDHLPSNRETRLRLRSMKTDTSSPAELPPRLRRRSACVEFTIEDPMKLHLSLANPFLVFVYSLAILLVGCAIGMHWKGSPELALSLVIGGATAMVIHDLVSGFLMFWATTKFARLAFPKDPPAR